MGDYCRRIYAKHISLGFQLDNPITFDIKIFAFNFMRQLVRRASYQRSLEEVGYVLWDLFNVQAKLCNIRLGKITIVWFFFDRSSKRLVVVYSKWYNPDLEGTGREISERFSPMLNL